MSSCRKCLVVFRLPRCRTTDGSEPSRPQRPTVEGETFSNSAVKLRVSNGESAISVVFSIIHYQQAQNSPLPLWQDTMGCFLKSAPERCGNEKSQRQSCCSETLLSTGVSSMPRV